MRKIRLTASLLFTISLIACTGSSSNGPSLTATFTPIGAVTDNSVTLEEVSSTGATVTVAVRFNSIAEPFKGAAVEVHYDAALMTVSAVHQGDILSGGVTFLSTDVGAGVLVISNADATVSGSSGGTFCTIEFRGLAPGSGAVTLLSASSAIFNGAEDTIPGVTWGSGTVVIN